MMKNKSVFAKGKQILLLSIKRILYCVVIGCFIFVSGCSILDSTINRDQGHENDHPQEPADNGTHTTVQELLDVITPLSIEDAINQYFDQWYYITGQIRAIDSSDDRGFIGLVSKALNGTSAATFVFETMPAGFDDLQEGQTVTIKGYLDGPSYELMVHLLFDECELIEVVPVETPPTIGKEETKEDIETSRDIETAESSVDEDPYEEPSKSDEEILEELSAILDTYRGQHIEPHTPFDEGAKTTTGYGHIEVNIEQIEVIDKQTMFISLTAESHANNGDFAGLRTSGTVDMLADFSVPFEDDGWGNRGVLSIYFLDNGRIAAESKITEFDEQAYWGLNFEYRELPSASGN